MKKKSLFEKERFDFKRKCFKKNCLKPGIYKAPKSKNEIRNYIWFCEEHIKSYNKEWNYCKDMSQKEIENHIELDTIGWRPTWNFSTSNLKFKNFDKIFSNYFDFFKKKKDESKNRRIGPLIKNALKVLNINTKNININLVENKYKKLVKKYHPDKNKGSKIYEEKLKEINHAFAIIKKFLITKLN
tara:strand:+ start:28 stop:585 length:558 start_codon:yes stop_codon:yes gene_type:complete